jgi:hypothetical protein
MYTFELIMQKKTVRLYFIQNIYDNDDLIAHVHHGRSQSKHNYVRSEQQTHALPLVRKDNWLRLIHQRENGKSAEENTRTQMSHEAENRIVIDDAILKIWQGISKKVNWSLETRTQCTIFINIIVFNHVQMNMNMSLRKTIDKWSNKYNKDDLIQSYPYRYRWTICHHIQG